MEEGEGRELEGDRADDESERGRRKGLSKGRCGEQEKEQVTHGKAQHVYAVNSSIGFILKQRASFVERTLHQSDGLFS